MKMDYYPHCLHVGAGQRSLKQWVAQYAWCRTKIIIFKMRKYFENWKNIVLRLRLMTILKTSIKAVRKNLKVHKNEVTQKGTHKPVMEFFNFSTILTGIYWFCSFFPYLSRHHNRRHSSERSTVARALF